MRFIVDHASEHDAEDGMKQMITDDYAVVADDDPIMIQSEDLSDLEIGHAGVKDICDIKDYRIRCDGPAVIHTINFGQGSSLEITYENTGRVVRADAKRVVFERLGTSLRVMPDWAGEYQPMESTKPVK
jgi:hypothetical protein